MNTKNNQQKLTRQDWFWIVFVAVVGTIGTFGGFVLFLPAYVVALFIGYLATKKYPAVFDRSRRMVFVLKVLAVVVPIFAMLCLIEYSLLPSVYKP